MWDIIRAFRECCEEQLGRDEQNTKDDSTFASSSDARSELYVLASPLNQYITICDVKKFLESFESRVNSILDEALIVLSTLLSTTVKLPGF